MFEILIRFIIGVLRKSRVKDNQSWMEVSLYSILARNASINKQLLRSPIADSR